MAATAESSVIGGPKARNSAQLRRPCWYGFLSVSSRQSRSIHFLRFVPDDAPFWLRRILEGNMNAHCFKSELQTVHRLNREFL